MFKLYVEEHIDELSNGAHLESESYNLAALLRERDIYRNRNPMGVAWVEDDTGTVIQ